jgi:hypothetical protein
MDFEGFRSQIADAPQCFLRKLREYLQSPTERNACFVAGYVAALKDAHLFEADVASYWQAVIDLTEDNDELNRDLLVEMDNPPRLTDQEESRPCPKST